MKFVNKTAVALAAAIGFTATSANAELLSVSGPASSAGTLAEIISAPEFVTNSNAFNTGLQGFDEQQGVVLMDPLSVDGGVIAAGTRVDSHMIFLNKQNGVPGRLSHANVEWTFSGEILGIMIDVNGLDEMASTAVLGALGTTYDTFNNRGLEGNDLISFAGVTLTTSFLVTQPGDWVRVITASEIPLPAGLPLFLAGMAGLGFVKRKKQTA